MLHGTKKLLAGVMVIGAVAAGTLDAGAFAALPKRTTYLNFGVPVALPGVSLAAGTYIFEMPDPDHAWGVVQVLSRDRSQVFYTGFTKVVTRRRGGADTLVSFREAPATTPQPIAVWWPYGGTTGHQFQPRP